jgi:hypothetical protein
LRLGDRWRVPEGLRGLGLSVIPACEYMDPPALIGIDDILVCGVWLLGTLGEAVELEVPLSTLGGYSAPPDAARVPPPVAGAYAWACVV